ncbi:hypothetical protein TNIN_304641 [Trichonephila inaurata madagascariensis]|uniref:Uncharacterized protein n=1 Tax=Trichonephila inaurata madagascariensis TaxID=2747483 RepID=A0A8X7C7M5_9ARAC|nr:hypothetical protein TNIN_304641 [Trichonephila inaurata madagascariensis]
MGKKGLGETDELYSKQLPTLFFANLQEVLASTGLVGGEDDNLVCVKDQRSWRLCHFRFDNLLKGNGFFRYRRGRVEMLPCFEEFKNSLTSVDS